MNRTTVIIIAAVAIVAVAAIGVYALNSNNSGQGDGGDKTAIVYFSYTGNTDKVAKMISDITGGDLLRIEAAVPYTKEDTEYGKEDCRAMIEAKDPTARPGIAKDVDISGYSRIYLGYPIWHGDSPKIMWTFTEAHDFKGKTIIPFCTAADSDVGDSAKNLDALTDDGKWLDGKRFFKDVTESELREWISGLKL